MGKERQWRIFLLQVFYWFSWEQQSFFYGKRGRRAQDQDVSDVRLPVTAPAGHRFRRKRIVAARIKKHINNKIK